MLIIHFTRNLLARFFCLLLVLGSQGCTSKDVSLDVTSKQGGATILGEFHGTREIASILQETVARSKLHGPVAIGLEAPSCAFSSVIPRDSILSISGDSERPCDYSGMAEGRVSDEILLVVNNVLADETVKVFGIENGRGRFDGVWDPNIWEGLVADRIKTIASKGYEVVVVTGNYHARKGSYTFGGETTIAFAARLGIESRSVLVVPRKSGEAYTCVSFGVCERTPTPASSMAQTKDGLNCDVDVKNYDCVYTVQTYTASKPIPPEAWKLE